MFGGGGGIPDMMAAMMADMAKGGPFLGLASGFDITDDDGKLFP